MKLVLVLSIGLLGGSVPRSIGTTLATDLLVDPMETSDMRPGAQVHSPLLPAPTGPPGREERVETMTAEEEEDDSAETLAGKTGSIDRPAIFGIRAESLTASPRSENPELFRLRPSTPIRC
jgi:hypothetical protein